MRLAEQGDYVVQLSVAELAGRRRLLILIADVAPIKRAERLRSDHAQGVGLGLRFVQRVARRRGGPLRFSLSALSARRRWPRRWDLPGL